MAEPYQTQPARIVSPIVEYFQRNNMARNYTEPGGERCEMVTLNFPTQNYQQAYYFAPNNVLDGSNCTITAIEVVPNVIIGEIIGVLEYIPDGRQNFESSGLNNGVLYVSNLQREVISEIPLVSMVRSSNDGKLCFTHFDDQVWQNCYIQFTATSFTTAIRPLTLNVWYNTKEKN